MNVTSEQVDRLKAALDSHNWVGMVESPLAEQLRETRRIARREHNRLIVWQVTGVMGWLAFLAVVVVAGMR